jgi:excisionase family DNA binding protein
MSTELKLINRKLDTLTEELQSIKTALISLGNNSPPLSLGEAAAYLHLSKSRIYDLVYIGKLKPLQHRKGGRILFSRESLNQYLYEKQL